MLGSFCHRCGEQQFDQKKLSLNHVSKEVFSSATELDGKFLGSMWLLVSKPGQLTLDYISGKRKLRLSPFQLLLLINIMFFLVAAYRGHSSFTTDLYFHTHSTNFIHQNLANHMVVEQLASSAESEDSYTQRFNTMVETQAKSLVMLMVPMFALVVWALYPRQEYPVIGSLVFATHLFSFILIIQALVPPLISKIILWLLLAFSLHIEDMAFELIYSAILFTVIAIYFFLACRKVYRGDLKLNILKTFLFVISIYWIYLIYRMILFFTTFYLL